MPADMSGAVALHVEMSTAVAAAAAAAAVNMVQHPVDMLPGLPLSPCSPCMADLSLTPIVEDSWFVHGSPPAPCTPSVASGGLAFNKENIPVCNLNDAIFNTTEVKA
jgi:hypothetical protein